MLQILLAITFFFFLFSYAKGENLTITQLLELKRLNYILLPGEEPIYIDKPTPMREVLSVERNSTSSTWETPKTYAVIESLPCEKQKVNIAESILNKPIEFFYSFFSFCNIKKVDDILIINPKIKLTLLFPETKELIFEDKESAISYLSKDNNETSKLLYPLINVSDFLCFCNTLGIECYPMKQAVLAIGEERKIGLLEKYAVSGKPRYKVKGIITLLSENAKKEIEIDLGLRLSSNKVIGAPYNIETDLKSLTIDIGKGILNALEVKLKALEEEGSAYILSSPEIIVDAWEVATIFSGFEIPYITPGTSFYPSTVSFKSALLSLTVKPEPLPDGLIRLEIAQTKDTPETSFSIQGNIALSLNQLKTVLTVRENELIYLGGIKEHLKSKEKETPSFPIISKIFGKREKISSSRELYIFLTVSRL